MKLSRVSLIVAVLATVLTAPLSRAQDNKDIAKPERPAARERRPGGGAGGANQFDRIAERLKLSDEQKTKLQPIFREEMTKLRDLRQDTALTAEQRREKVRTIREEYFGKMKPILTTEQADQLKKMREQQGPGGNRRGPQGNANADKDDKKE
ncbi:MAG: hypothetical protein U1G07_21365 [Verrucomicrobiota bacterium]